MLTSAIDAQEERDAATVDVPGAYMEADMDDVVHIRFEGNGQVDTSIGADIYSPVVTEENGKLACAYEKGSIWNIGSCKVVLAETIQRAHVVEVCHKSI
jgi:hypothetical protein